MKKTKTFFFLWLSSQCPLLPRINNIKHKTNPPFPFQISLLCFSHLCQFVQNNLVENPPTSVALLVDSSERHQMLLKSLEGARCSGFMEKDVSVVKIGKDTDLVWLVKILERYWLADWPKGKILPWCLHWAGLWWSWSQSIYKWRWRKRPKQPDPIVDGITSGPVEPSFLLILDIWNAKHTHVQYWLERELSFNINSPF